MALTALNFKQIFNGICVHALYNMLSDLYIQYLVIKLCLKSIQGFQKKVLRPIMIGIQLKWKVAIFSYNLGNIPSKYHYI